MLIDIKLVSNNDGTYDILLEYETGNAEFGLDFDSIRSNLETSSQKALKFISGLNKNLKVSSVRIIVSGIMIASISFSSFIASFAAGDKYSMGYLYSGTEQQHIEYVNRTNGALDTVSPSYFDIEENGSLKLNYLSKNFINTMHSKGIKVVPFLSNHWNRTAGINALKNADSLSTKIANYISQYNLDGVNVDIENVTHEQRDQYTEFVRLLRQKVPKNKEVSVAVAANPNGWKTGWHGSYDYAGLAKYADYLLIMAYDEHYEGGSSGPVASLGFVEKSIKYALTKTTPDKLVIGVPFYGRVWSVDNNKIIGKGASIETINKIIRNCDSVVTYDESAQAVKAEFRIKKGDANYSIGGGYVLKPGNYVAWFENDRSYQSKLKLVSKYNLKGAGAWSLGQEDSSIWKNYDSWLNGGSSSSGSSSSSPSTNKPSSKPGNSNSSSNSNSNSRPSNNQSSSGGSPESSSVDNPKSESHESQTINENGDSTYSSTTSEISDNSIDTNSIESDSGSEETNTDNADYDKDFPIPSHHDGKTVYIKENYFLVKDTQNKKVGIDESILYKPNHGYIIHKVRPGDTLESISIKYLGSREFYKKIKELNDLENETIYPGMRLKIPINQNYI